MSKGAVGLVAGYWPEDVYRYLATPGLYLDDGLVSRPAKKRPDAPAVLTASETLTYGALSDRVDRVAAAIVRRLEGNASRVALAVSDQLTLLVVFFGAMRARCRTLLLDPHASDEVLAAQLIAFAPDVLVADDAALQRANSGARDAVRRTVRPDELVLDEGRPAKTKLRLGLKAPAVTITRGGGRFVHHSHTSLLAGALSWGTFAELKEDEVFLGLQPLHTWEGLYSVLPSLFRGGACLLAAPGAGTLAPLVRRYRPRYTVLPMADAFALAADHDVMTEVRTALQGVFVSVTGTFRPADRRRLKSALGLPVLTVLGRQDAGPILASHPSWYLDQAVGIPVTNVDVWPLNPATGNPLQVPWEAIERAEIGVKSPMLAVEYDNAEEMRDEIPAAWLRTRLVGMMDPSGFFYLL